MKKGPAEKIIPVIALLAAVVFVIRFAGPSFLKLYIDTGIGSCRKIPILCMEPQGRVIAPAAINKEYLDGLLPYDFPKMSLRAPHGFSVTQEQITKDYYNRRGRRFEGPAIYVLYEKPGFFTGLFPRVRKRGVVSNYDFIRRTMYARTDRIADLTDAFFVIMKGIFTPGLGENRDIRMEQFKIGDEKGFINYSIGGKENYFDCNVIKGGDNFFKVYIKDADAALDLNSVLAIISTLDNNNQT